MNDDVVVTVSDLHCTIGGHEILHGINLEVHRGEIFSIMGMSGSGKTTLLKCMAGLHEATSGSIMIDGNDITKMTEREMDAARTRIGFVFQYAALFDSLSVHDNVAFGPTHNSKQRRTQIDETVEQRLADVGMEGSGDLYPAELSGGMQKRVGLARALAMEPTLVLYDEPTSGLDPVIARAIDDLIVSTRDRNRVTSVMVSHDIRSILRVSDRIAMIHEGNIIASGSPDEIRNNNDPRVQEFVNGG